MKYIRSSEASPNPECCAICSVVSLRRFQQPAGEQYSLCDEPAVWRCAGADPELAVEGPVTHRGRVGELADGRVLREVFERPAQRRARPLAASVGYRLLDELGLAAFAVRADHQGAAQAVGDLRAVVLAHQVQAQLDPAGAVAASASNGM